MDAQFLLQDLQYFSSSGHVMSSEQMTQLANSLTIAKHNNKFSKIFFWGKIYGIKEDYLIAQGISGNDELTERTTLYSVSGNDWHLLSIPDEKTQEDALQIRGRFMGDPMHDYEQHEVKRFTSGENNEDTDDIAIQVKEEARLAAVIMKIDEEAMLVPRGAFLRSPAGIVMKNGSFSGLDDKQVSNLENWFHFSGPIKLPKKSLLEKADLAAPIDFLEQASIDVPFTGSWSIQNERGPGVDSSLIKLRSLHWPGAESCHIPNTKQFARAYFGDGLKNINLPFMLPSSS